jgi:hypothetical protein
MLGQANVRALKTKDPISFQAVLTSFLNWAKTNDLKDLNFMIPQDEEISGLFFNYLQNSTYIYDSKSI